MDSEHFASFLAGIGHRVLRTTSAYWYDVGRAFFLSIPSHSLLQPAPAELREVLRRQPCFGLRFPAPLECPGRISYQIICEGKDYGLDCLSANARSKVRRGLRRCEVRPVDFAEIAACGRQADLDTLARQKRGVRLSIRGWSRYWETAGRTAGMEGWAAFLGGEMAAFLVTIRLDDSVEFYAARSRSEHLSAYPNNALIFTVVREMLGGRGLRQVTFGLESLEPVDSLDDFKFSMGFRRRPIRQRVVFHPLVRALLRPRAVRSLLHGWASRGSSEGVFWRKAAGLLRFAEEGGL